MLIRSLGAENFLSFDRFELELQEGLTVVVGPNGGGKSNVVRILDVVRRGVEGANSEQPHGTSSLRVYADAARQGADGGGFRVALGVALHETVERELLVSWVRAAVMMEFLANEQTFRAREELDRFVFDRVSAAELESLFEGQLVVVYEAAPADSFVVGYEFTFEGETFCYQLVGGSRTGMIVAGELDPRPGPSSYSPKPGRALLLDDPGTTSPPPQEPLVFTFERLLPPRV
jgi:energy-coupling factor transporter ATP-binding protein EcfA2